MAKQRAGEPSARVQRLRAKRAEASIAGALLCDPSPAAINGALRAVVARLAPDDVKGEQLHRAHVSARKAFTTFLRRRGCR